MGLKFMQKAEQNKKEILKEQARMLMDQIKEDQKDDYEGGAFLKAAGAFKQKALPVPEIKQ